MSDEAAHADLGGYPGHADLLMPGVSHVSAKFLKPEHRVRVTFNGQPPYAAALEVSLTPGQWRQVISAVTRACPLAVPE